MNDITTELAKQYKKSQQEVDTAWEFAKTQAQSKYKPNDEEFFPYVTDLAKKMLGTTPDEKMTGVNPAKTVSQGSTMFNGSMFENDYPEIRAMLKEETKKFKWLSKSTKIKAFAQFEYSKENYEVSLTLFSYGDPKFNLMGWKPLLDQNIKTVLKISVDKFNNDGTYLKINADGNRLTKAKEFMDIIISILKNYETLFGSNHFQLVILSTNDMKKMSFYKDFKPYLISRFTNLKPCTKIEDFLNKIKEYPSNRILYNIVMKNSKSSVKMTEDEGADSGGDGEGTVMSSDFGDALPFDARHKWKKDGNQVNKDAKKSLKKMGIL